MQGINSGSYTIIYVVIIIVAIFLSNSVTSMIDKKAEGHNLGFLDLVLRMAKARRRIFLSKSEADDTYGDSSFEEKIRLLKVICLIVIIPIVSIFLFIGLKYLFEMFPFLNFLPKLSDSFY